MRPFFVSCSSPQHTQLLLFLHGAPLKMRFALLLLPFMFTVGCTDSGKPAATKAEQAASLPAPPSAAEMEAIAALEAAGVKVAKTEAGHATGVDFRGVEVTAELLAGISALPTVTVANFAETNLDDEMLNNLVTTADSLNNFDLRDCSISDAGLKTLAGVEGIRAIRLSGKSGNTTVTDDGLAHLAGLASLKLLALDDVWIGTAGLAHLKNLPGLAELYLAGTLVDDDSIAIVSGMPGIRKLRLARTQVGDAALEALTACSSLEELDLSEDSLLTDAGMVSLGKITSLKKLNLWRVQINNEGALALAPLVNLQWLNLDNTKLSDGGLAALKDMAQLKFLHLGSTQITADGIESLFHLTTLDDLKITRTAMGASADAVAALAEKLPDTAIQTEYEGE